MCRSAHRLTVVIACLILLGLAGSVCAQENLVKNASFETDANKDGVPDNWTVAGSPQHVTQTVTLDEGRDGKRCGLLNCSKFEGGVSSSHAMLAQMGVPVQQGRYYRLTLWARGEKITAGGVSIDLRDTRNWRSSGLQGTFVPLPLWQRFEFLFRARATVGETSRFQMAFLSTGKLWVDDISLTEVKGDPYRPGHVHASAGHVNLVPNASFECGTDGWGSSETDYVGHWAGGLNQLFGEVDRKEAYQGKQSLRIDLTPKNTPVSSWDYFDPIRKAIRAPLAGNIGFLEVEPGQSYTLSVYLKAREANTRARLGVRGYSRREIAGKYVDVSREWARYELTFRPREKWCYVLAGPDLRRAPRDATATLWVDAVQFEKGETATPFRARETLEVGLETDRVGNIFDWTEPVSLRVMVANAGAEQRPELKLTLTDFEDKTVWGRTLRPTVPTKDRFEQEVRIQPDERMRGFLQLHVKTGAGATSIDRKIRLAVIPTYKPRDSRFGVNHPYPYPHLLGLCRKAGLNWVRDWSLKWHNIEPEKGRFTFGEIDYQIDRSLKHDLSVLGLFPFPSSMWSSTKPNAEAKNATEKLAVAAARPRDEGEVSDYITRTVKHYKGRIRWYQYLNEPLYTHYALPSAQGNDGATYARLTEVFARA